MKKLTKHLLTLSTLALISVGFSSCGGNGGESISYPESSSATTSENVNSSEDLNSSEDIVSSDEIVSSEDSNTTIESSSSQSMISYDDEYVENKARPLV